MFKKGDTATNANTNGNDFTERENSRYQKPRKTEGANGTESRTQVEELAADDPRDFSSHFKLGRYNKIDGQRHKQERRSDCG